MTRPSASERFRASGGSLRWILALGLAGVLLGALPGPAPPADLDLERIAGQYYTPKFRATGGEFHRVREITFFFQLGLTLGVAWWLALGSLSRWNEWAWAWARGRSWLARIFVLTALTLVFLAVRLPFSLFRYFHADLYGLRNDTWLEFLLDWGKAAGIGWAMTVVVGVVVLGLFSVLPRAWWAVSALAVAALTVGYVALSPIVIDPLFNRFEKLDNPELEARLLALSAEGGIPAREVLVADASRRSRSVNAYFTGVGSTRRIVVYDTLVEKFSSDEIAIVVAHEIGHWKNHHIRFGLALALVATLVGLLVAHVVLGRWVDREAHGLYGRGDPALAVPAYALYLTLMAAAIVPANWISRQMEAQADLESLVLTRDPATFIRTETRLAEENLSDVLPPAWIEFTLYSHPCNVRRIRIAERFQ
jgi:STE24 endopeptidase